VPSNLIPIAALIQSIKNELAWWESNPKILQQLNRWKIYLLIYFSAIQNTKSWRRSENRAQNVAFKHHIRSICLYRHCNALHFGNKLAGRVARTSLNPIAAENGTGVIFLIFVFIGVNFCLPNVSGWLVSTFVVSKVIDLDFKFRFLLLFRQIHEHNEITLQAYQMRYGRAATKWPLKIFESSRHLGNILPVILLAQQK